MFCPLCKQTVQCENIVFMCDCRDESVFRGHENGFHAACFDYVWAEFVKDMDTMKSSDQWKNQFKDVKKYNWDKLCEDVHCCPSCEKCYNLPDSFVFYEPNDVRRVPKNRKLHAWECIFFFLDMGLNFFYFAFVAAAALLAGFVFPQWVDRVWFFLFIIMLPLFVDENILDLENTWRVDPRIFDLKQCPVHFIRQYVSARSRQLKTWILDMIGAFVLMFLVWVAMPMGMVGIVNGVFGYKIGFSAPLFMVMFSRWAYNVVVLPYRDLAPLLCMPNFLFEKEMWCGYRAKLMLNLSYGPYDFMVDNISFDTGVRLRAVFFSLPDGRYSVLRFRNTQPPIVDCGVTGAEANVLDCKK